MRAVLLALAAGQAVVGLWLGLFPGSFYDALGNFGPRSDHGLRDVASVNLAFAVALVLAAGRPAWRAPVLAVVALQHAIHTLNHLLDVGKADPAWVGPFDAVSLAVIAAGAAWLARLSARRSAPASS